MIPWFHASSNTFCENGEAVNSLHYEVGTHEYTEPLYKSEVGQLLGGPVSVSWSAVLLVNRPVNEYGTMTCAALSINQQMSVDQLTW